MNIVDLKTLKEEISSKFRVVVHFSIFFFNFYGPFSNMVIVLKFHTFLMKWHMQTVQIQIRLLLK